jgi:hypothetical protein
MRLEIFAVLLLVWAPFTATAEPLRRVRATDAALANLIERGSQRSATLRGLIGRIEAGDWVVFVQLGRCPDRVMVGCLIHFVGAFEGRPYLRIVIATLGRHPDQVIATVAHELQHAIEVIFDGGVTDGASMSAPGRRIIKDHYRTSRATIYETSEARRVGDAVLRELLRY